MCDFFLDIIREALDVMFETSSYFSKIQGHVVELRSKLWHSRSQESGVRSPLFSTTTKGYSTFCQQHKHKCNRNIIHGKCNDVFLEWFAVVDGRHIKAKAAVMRLPRRHDFDLLLLRVLVIEYECIRKIVLFLCHEMMRSKKIKLIIKIIIKMKTKKNKW